MPFDWLPIELLIAFFAALGAIVGSFLNVVVARLPIEGESIVHPRSRCPQCKTMIAAYDNVPIFSWIILRGKCRHCKAPIAVRYPVVEALGAAMFAALFVRFGFSWELLIWIPLSAALLAIIFLDIDHWWVPDVIVYPAMLWAAGGSLLPGGLTPPEALIGLVPAIGLWGFTRLFSRAIGKEAMGMGDIKLMALLGLALGAWTAFTALTLAAIQGAVVAVAVMLTGGHQGVDDRSGDERSGEAGDGDPTDSEEPDGEEPDGEATAEEEWKPDPRAVPFGPFLAIGAFEVVLLPHVFSGLHLRWGELMMGLFG